jgi:hypothetical protein
LLVFSISGCSSIPQEKVDEIVIGKTTKAEIVELFGNPNEINTGKRLSEELYIYKRGGDRLAIQFTSDGVVNDQFYIDDQ